jgi:hypothetical protein
MSSTGKGGEGKRSANGKTEDDKGSNKVKGKSKDDRGSNKDKVSDKGEGKGSGKAKRKSKDDKGSIQDQGIRKDNKSKDDKDPNKVKGKGKSKDDMDSNKEGKNKGVRRKRGAAGGGLKISVETGDWPDIWWVDVNQNDNIKNIKSNIANAMRWSCNLELVLEYKNEILKDTSTLRDYHVKNKSRLRVSLAEKNKFTLRRGKSRVHVYLAEGVAVLQPLGSDYTTIQQ